MTIRNVSIVLIVFAFFLGSVVHAETDCDSCSGFDADSALSNLISRAGFAPEDYMVLMAWEERAPATEEILQGVRLRDALAQANAFDLYFDAKGRLLNATDLEAYDVQPKNWDVAPVSRPAEQVPAQSAARVATAIPKTANLPKVRVALPAPDVAALEAEDATAAQSGGKAAMRYGARVAPAEAIRVSCATVSAGAWRLEGGYWIWSVELHAAGALGQRLHFATLQLPDTAQVLVYDAADPAEAYAVVPQDTPFWGPTTFSETVTVECSVSTQADIAEVQMLIDETTYHYRAMGELPWKQAGSCNIDVTCEEEWEHTGLGVGGLGSVGINGALWCTGSLIVDTDPATNIPYFMTANHCVENQGEANSVEVYWLYQTPVCNGAEPDPATVPRTRGGADYLAGSTGISGTDFALLRLRSQPPGGVTYLGYNTAPQPVSTDVVCIHHPRGDFKRISFGDITNEGSPSREQRIQPISRYHEVIWNRATTEPGSSGSPLFIESTQQFIGQLWGGLAACSLPNEPDYYGRFDVSYPLVESWLNTAPPSVYDVNGDGQVNSLDLQLVVNAALGKSTLEEADFDESGRVDAVDVQQMVGAILSS